MQTPEQRANQARENGAKSTGPKTEAGKERIAESNARRAQRNELLRLLVPPHHAVFCTEDRNEYYGLLDDYIAKYRPTDNVELEVVGELVSYAWRMKRLAITETALWNRELVRQDQHTTTAFPELQPLENLINTTEAFAENDRTLRKLARDRAECIRLIAATERRLVRLRRHFPAQGVNLVNSAEEREKFCFDPPADDDSHTPKPTEVVENTNEAAEKQDNPEPINPNWQSSSNAQETADDDEVDDDLPEREAA